MLLDSFLLAVLIPAYPLPPSQEIPDPVRISAMQEFTNPYKCSRNITGYMNGLGARDIFRKPDSEIETDLHHVYSDLWILSMNVGYSCHIAQDPPGNDKSSNKSEILKTHIGDTSSGYLMSYYSYNSLRARISQEPVSRESIRKLPEYTELSKSGIQNSEEKLAFNLLDLTLMLQENSILDAEKLLKSVLQKSSESSISPHIRAAALLQAYYLYDYAGENERALGYLEDAVSVLDSPFYTYTRALISHKAARAFEEEHNYKKAMYYAEIYLHTMGSIPSQSRNYLQALIEFSDYCLLEGKTDTAFMVLRRAEGLAQSASSDRHTAAIAYMKLGSVYAINERFGDARIYTEKGCSILRTEKEDPPKELTDCEIGLLDIYIRGHNGEAAQNLAKKLKVRIPDMTESQKNLYYRKAAAIEAGHRNYRDAYEILRHVVIAGENRENVPAAGKKQLKDSLDSSPSSGNRDIGNVVSYLNESYLFYPAAISFLIFLMLCLVLIIVSNRYLSLKKKIARLNIDQDTSNAAPDKRAFLSYITELRMDYIPQQNYTRKNPRPLVLDEKLIICFSVPGFAGLSVSRGSKYASQIMQIFFQAMKLRFPADLLFQLSDTEFITVQKINSEKVISETMEHFFHLLEEVLDEIRMEFSVTAGIINYPLLMNDPYRLPSEKILEVILTALSGAQEIRKATGNNAWVKIRPKSATISDFEGDARQKTIDGIIKKEIHVINSEPGFIIDWRRLDEENKY